MKVIDRILLAYSYVYETVLALFLVALGGLTLASGIHNLRLTMLPWTGASLTHWVFWSGVAGLLATVLAVTRLFRWLFPLWCLFVFVMMVRGFFLNFSGYVFSGPTQFWWVVALTAGALGAFLSSLILLKRQPSRY